ncbi:peptide ABC transporter permease [Thermosipho africanus H17ap60334]|jgi:peptide/nickel transport system permease protein|uniref:ABC-type dipeptide/oligopeptide/nickel transport systems, permease component n=1 Tax=Thermosipho africanus (strain TCF52B) TaxID=484019 RepID=B7IGL9_THEAB|nr:MULTISPECIES: ABC transporter permease [Thermosipho]HCF38879.1 ABC transporter permease [Thermosipho africanus]ACJ75233.1 ABC-type dipeptide/oligopeptide/nickel transport systems, permease component [Thermosipho africanus TCF52B]EKF50302.1 peptide ABC transporter permease [Thermosipho africanus H17ap60334]MBZ4649856.1 ABC-type dipeptide/oligopeptide/nickel transport system, permease component [Thermosipho sp. (in: thermotogales)]MDK2839421.1 peptide/nickel transport system permease protein 
MKKYLRNKIIIYILTFIFAVTIDWLIPRLMPGNPILVLVSRFSGLPDAAKVMYSYLTKAFGLDQPLWTQYVNFWIAFFKGDLGISIYLYPKPVLDVLKSALPYSLGLLIPSILISWIIGNNLGAFAARRKKFDSFMLPVMYFLTGAPYLWLGILLAYFFGVVLRWVPIAGAYSFSLRPHFSWTFIADFLKHWILPFLSLFIVQLGGWAIGMRNMVIYELENNYVRFLETMGVKRSLIKKYTFRNAILPQVTGLALQLGTVIAGQVATEVVFSYPGVGYILTQAILNQDYFLIQGCFLFIIIGVLVANFTVDLVYMILDPRIRYSYGGEA